MRIIVLGAGAIGSLYGAKLSKLNEVTLIGRKEHANAINKHGLKITGLENKKYRVKAATKVDEIKENTLVLLATKVTDSEKAVKDIKNLVKDDTTVLCLQNGLYSENVVKKVLGKKCLVLRAVTNFGAAFLKPGIVKYNSYSYTAIEMSANRSRMRGSQDSLANSPISDHAQKSSIFDESERSRKIAENLKRCGLNGHVSENIKYDMWKKLIFNCALNPITAILKVENKGIADERLNPLKRLIVKECLEVAKRDGINFGFDFVEIINNEFKNSVNISSMQQDILKGKKTEIGYLNGGVVELGRKYGIRCPVNEALVEIIKGMEEI